MKISELISRLCAMNHADEAVKQHSRTVDSVKCGDVEREVTRVAVSMFGTPDVIRQAAEWGAQLLIVHEPLFGCNSEEIKSGDFIREKKWQLLRDSGLTVFRFHDHPHRMEVDMIDRGTIVQSGLPGKITGKPFFAVTTFELEQPLTAREIVAQLETHLNADHIRIAGAPDVPGRRIAFACGTPGHIQDLLLCDSVDFIVTGEICEWAEGEMARDQAQMGMGKAILVLGHEVSERCGMKALAGRLSADSEFETRYFESGDVYCDRF